MAKGSTTACAISAYILKKGIGWAMVWVLVVLDFVFDLWLNGYLGGIGTNKIQLWSLHIKLFQIEYLYFGIW